MQIVTQGTTALPRYTECLLAIADAYLTHGLRHGGLSMAHWDSLVRKGYRTYPPGALEAPLLEGR